jgi:hypothetical protein
MRTEQEQLEHLEGGMWYTSENSREELAGELLQNLYKVQEIDYYDFIAEKWGHGSDAFKNCRLVAEELVNEKLARFSNEAHTLLEITNLGRYWMLNGGYMSYLHDSEIKATKLQKQHLSEMKEELRQARLRFTQYRIVTFWWTFGFSIISFILSIISIFLVLWYRK